MIDLESKKLDHRREKKSKSMDRHQNSLNESKCNETLRPSVSFADEIIKSLDIKNILSDNNSFENKFRGKQDSYREPYFNYKNCSLDDSLNEVCAEHGKKLDQKCEMQIYKTDKPFFLRPCMSFRMEDKSDYDTSKICIKRQKNKSKVDNGEKNASTIKSNSRENKNQASFDHSITKLSDGFKKSETNLLTNDHNEPFYGNFFNYLKILRRTDLSRRRLSRIPIRQGSSLERRPDILIRQIKKPKKYNFDFNAKKYDEIFEKMRQNDKENRLDYLVNLSTKNKNNSKLRKELKLFAGFVTILSLLLATNLIFSVNLLYF